jgi:ATP-dependent Clp protease protease subunit
MVPWKVPNTPYYQFVPIGQRFYRERIIILTDFLDEARSNNLIATLLYLKQQDSTKQITLYFNVPGALMKPSLAVYDTIKSLKCPVMTLNLGLATGMAAFLCAAGTPGKRFALPNSRFLLQKTGLDDPYRGQAVDIALRVRNVILILDICMVSY